jgi:hypothetical protein
MKTKGLLVPLSYQENEEQCFVCLAKTALDEALEKEFNALDDLAQTLLDDRTPLAAALQLAVRKLVSALRLSQTEYAVAFAVSLTLYHTVEKPGLHREARESVQAYQEYRNRVVESQIEVLSYFATFTAACQRQSWAQPIQLALEKSKEARMETGTRNAAFWELADKWSESRHDKAWDFLDQLTA